MYPDPATYVHVLGTVIVEWPPRQPPPNNNNSADIEIHTDAANVNRITYKWKGSLHRHRKAGHNSAVITPYVLCLPVCRPAAAVITAAMPSL